MPALVEARESLSYWENRLHTLPRRSVRARREAREMAERWRARVMEAEYGAGLLGAVFQLMAEKRLPTQTSRQLVRVGKGAAIVAATTVATLTLIAVLLFVALLVLIF